MKLLLANLFPSHFTMSMRPLLLFFLVVVGCNTTDPVEPTSPSNNTPPTETPVTEDNGATNRIKRNRLVGIIPSDVFYPSYSLRYDSMGKLKTIVTHGYAPSSYHVYWKNDTIDHIINTSSINGQIKTLSNIFIYNANKQCYKILTKARNNWDHGQDSVIETNPFFSNSSDDLYEKFDSLVYSPMGQLTEIWDVNKYGKSKTLALQYADTQSQAPSNVQWFCASTTDESGVLCYDLALAANNIDQPIFYALWFLPFLVPAESMSTPLYAPVTPQTTPGFFYMYMPLVKKCVTEWTFTDLTATGGTEYGYSSVYYYNSDSTEFTGRRDPDDVGFPRFTYLFQKL